MFVEKQVEKDFYAQTAALPVGFLTELQFLYMLECELNCKTCKSYDGTK